MTESQTTDVLVLGGSIPGAVVALECARLGLAVTIVGSLPPAITSDVDNAGGGITLLLDTLQADGQFNGPDYFQPVEPHTPLVLNAGGKAVPVPAEIILGIPSSPLSADVAAAIGRGASFRAYLDRLKPVLTIGKEHNLEHLVVQRMGRGVLDVLVTPLVVEQYGALPVDVDVSVAIPGLNEAITRTGSLSTAVLASADSFRRHAARFQFEDDAHAFISALHRAHRYWNVRVIDELGDEQDARVETLRNESRVTVLAGSEDDARHQLPGDISRDMFVPHRQYSEWRIELRDRATSAVGDLDQIFPQGLVAVARDRDGAPVSLRVLEAAESSVIIRVSGPRSGSRSALRMAEDTAMESPNTTTFVTSEYEVIEAFASVLERRSGMSTTLTHAHFEANVVRHREAYAPFLSSDELHNHKRILSQLDERDDIRVVGEWLHEGSLAGAIGHAKLVAQSLRRSLLGIT